MDRVLVRVPQARKPRTLIRQLGFAELIPDLPPRRAVDFVALNPLFGMQPREHAADVAAVRGDDEVVVVGEDGPCLQRALVRSREIEETRLQTIETSGYCYP